MFEVFNVYTGETVCFTDSETWAREVCNVEIAGRKPLDYDSREN